MIKQVAAAFERKDYHTAAQLLEQLLQESPQNSWVQFYLGRLDEVSGKLEAAEEIYRQLLRSTTNAKIVSQARQGLQRVQALGQEQRRQAIAQATVAPSNTQLGVLVLEPVPGELRTLAAQKFAQIMQLDPYTARLQLPSRGWRLYRTGAIGELRFLGENLRNSRVPCFWATLAEIQKIQVFQVSYFQESASETKVVCQNEQGQIGSLTFNWSEVIQRVTGLLPIFEEVVDLDHRGKLKRKTQTQDYAQFCDLHLPGRLCILRLHDRSYQFQQGVVTAPQPSQTNNQTTIRINWNSLVNFLDQQLHQVAVWSDFTPFAETVLDQKELLGRIQSHIHLFRRAETSWDPAFHLYSGLAFTRGQGEPASCGGSLR